jgi:5-methyltetrahydropteroyltriglutamate--homocysteine methyltransferase
MSAAQRRASGARRMAPALLPTTVIGSYSVPEWLGQLKNDWHQRRISRQYLDEMHEMAIKAAIVDQERAGIDIVSDGELRRDNDVDYLLARIPGVDIPHDGKADYFDYYDARAGHPLPDPGGPGLGLVEDFRFVRQLTDLPVKVSITGPFSLSRRIRDASGQDPADLVRGLARLLSAEARDLALAGAQLLQIDEPFLADYPEDVGLAIEAVNIMTAGADVSWTLHVCHGNRYARPLWASHYDFLFPAVQEAHVDQLALEFARTGDDDLSLLERHHWERRLGLGVIDVKTERVESPDLVAARIRRALRFVAPEKLVINPDCGLRHLAPGIARAKLAAMVAGAALVRAELGPAGEVAAGDAGAVPASAAAAAAAAGPTAPGTGRTGRRRVTDRGTSQ